MFAIHNRRIQIASALLCATLVSACQPGATAVPTTLPPPTLTTVALAATLVPPTATALPPTSTAVPPTATPVPPTATLAPSATPVGALDTGPFAGNWTGTMYLAADPAIVYARVAVSIPAACVVRQSCGKFISVGSGCEWELRLLAIDGDVFQYRFSRSLTLDECTLGGGTLTLQADGTLFREHAIAGSDIVSGSLTRQLGQP